MRDAEREQFRQFVAASGGRLIRVAMALTADRHAAEDLLQGALARTAARWRKVEGDPEAYVRRAMYHAQVTACPTRCGSASPSEAPASRPANRSW